VEAATVARAVVEEAVATAVKAATVATVAAATLEVAAAVERVAQAAEAEDWATTTRRTRSYGSRVPTATRRVVRSILPSGWTHEIANRRMLQGVLPSRGGAPRMRVREMCATRKRQWRGNRRCRR
jgi:hypothetical protein